MDGSAAVSQCPVGPGQWIRYEFEINQVGTYWYHSHNRGQYPDGLRGPLVIRDPNPGYHYDDEFTVTLTDWYNQQMSTLLDQYESQANQAQTGGLEPLPDAALIGDSLNTTYKVEPNKTYLVRIICVGNWPGHVIIFDDHDLTIVEVDGVPTVPYPVEDKNIRIATGQRMSVLIQTKNDTSRNYAIWDQMDINMLFFYPNRTIPQGYNLNATAWLVYDEAKPLPPPDYVYTLDFVDDIALTPADKEPLLEPVDHQIIMDIDSAVINGIPRFTVNNQTYLPQEVPSLYTALTVGPEYYFNPAVYGQVNPYVVNYGDIIEIVVNDYQNNLHPWHLHGHQFQVLQRTAPNGGYFEGYFANISATPIKRDTLMVQNHGHFVIRFRATNPGAWLFHCHIEWHVNSGLLTTIIEAPDHIKDIIPKDHINICKRYPEPYSGNAAGNTGLNLTGAETVVPTSDSGAEYPPTV